MQFEHGWSVLHSALLDEIWTGSFYIFFEIRSSNSSLLLIVRQSATIVGPLLTEVWQEEGGSAVSWSSVEVYKHFFWFFLVRRTYSKVIKHLQRKLNKRSWMSEFIWLNLYLSNLHLLKTGSWTKNLSKQCTLHSHSMNGLSLKWF